VLCVDCFQASEHQGHEVLFAQSFSFSATCDCGDPNAWKDHAYLGCTHHPPLPEDAICPVQPPGYITADSDISQNLLKAIHNTISICIDFIINTVQYSILPSELPLMPKNEKELLSPAGYATGEMPDRRGKGPWSVVLWADDKHVLKEVTRQVRDALGVTWEEGEVLARQVEELVSISIGYPDH
jgi:E3 ubiquitin-protein ligase UBR1